MTLNVFIRKRPYLVWYGAEPEGLSEKAIVEAVLNYGDFDDVRKLLALLGTKKVAAIFRSQMKKKRTNYEPKIANYFNLYFKKYAA
ncbi:hypothetical protein KJ616_00050 [Patescibacteria group bacterium]|nr:hypothetical protein [Patescibacteria group bacterium]